MASVASEGELDGDEPRVLLFMEAGRDRELLVETLGKRYQIATTTDVQTLESEFDCCVFDYGEFNRVADTIQSKRDTSNPVFLPFVLLINEETAENATGEIREYVDDVIQLPVRKEALLSRISNLVKRRRTAAKLAEREAQLKETVEDLKLKEQAMDEAPIGITIAETDGEDTPLIYVNERFENLTGYGSSMLGEDCRFLQGEETDPDTVAAMREAIDARRSVSVDILNYRRNGRKFWNNLYIAPIRDDDERSTQFVGFQTDITRRKIKERRLEVMNRVLSHNLRNKMNVIEGYLGLLKDEYDEADTPEQLEHVSTAASDLMGLADTVQTIERILDTPTSGNTTVQLDERIEQIIGALEDQFPAVSFDLTLPEHGSLEVEATGLVTAIKEACENAAKHNDSSRPVVRVAIERSSEDWVDIEITDNGPGIPSRELDILETGETALRHADRLGIWLIYWTVNRMGGELTVTDAETGGTTVRISVPARRQ